MMSPLHSDFFPFRSLSDTHCVCLTPPSLFLLSLARIIQAWCSLAPDAAGFRRQQFASVESRGSSRTAVDLIECRFCISLSVCKRMMIARGISRATKDKEKLAIGCLLRHLHVHSLSPHSPGDSVANSVCEKGLGATHAGLQSRCAAVERAVCRGRQ